MQTLSLTDQLKRLLTIAQLASLPDAAEYLTRRLEIEEPSLTNTADWIDWFVRRYPDTSRYDAKYILEAKREKNK